MSCSYDHVVVQISVLAICVVNRSGALIRRYADTPIRRYADTPLRRYAETPMCRYSKYA